METIESAKEKFGTLIEAQKKRVAAMRAQGDFVDYAALDTIIIGVCGGDGIGPTITKEAERVLRFLLQQEVAAGRVSFQEI
ncbi:MAG: isocitrate/isopropylmalate dehydrogenase family protein, partial [Ruthenibacterium sp.]